MRRKLTPEAVSEALEAVRAQESVSHIARRLGVSRQRIYQLAKHHGVELRAWTDRACGHCGAPLQVRRHRARQTRRSYCNPACYHAKLGESSYIENRHGQRIARRVVRRFFNLEDGHVVHHIDGDQGHNDPENLMVFRDHGDHMRWHRGGGPESGVVPLWP